MDYSNVLLDLMNRVIELEKRVSKLEAERKEYLRREPQTKVTTEESVAKGYESDFEPKKEGALHGTVEIQRRDSTKYILDGVLYKKNRLVLAVVQKYVQDRRGNITCDDLKAVFPKYLQGSLGVVERKEIACQRGVDYERRYFTESQEVIKLLDGEMYVCSQWGICNLPQFLNRAEQLGFDIRLA